MQIVAFHFDEWYFLSLVKDEADDSDNLAALTDFKEEDLKQFDEACNDFSNGKPLKFFEDFKRSLNCPLL